MKADATELFHILIKHTSNLLRIHTQRRKSSARRGSSRSLPLGKQVQSVFKFSPPTKMDSYSQLVSRDAAESSRLPFGGCKGEKNIEEKVKNINGEPL